jgi:hypothetical protein
LRLNLELSAYLREFPSHLHTCIHCALQIRDAVAPSVQKPCENHSPCGRCILCHLTKVCIQCGDSLDEHNPQCDVEGKCRACCACDTCSLFRR